MITQATSLHILAAKARSMEFEKDATLYTSDSSLKIFMVKSGYVKRYSIAADGRIGVQSIYGPGNIFPLTSLFKVLFNQDIYESVETYYYDAMCDTTLYVLDNAQILKEASSNPLLYKDILMVAGTRLESNIQRLENVNLRSAYKRVAHQLVFFARKHGKKYADGTRIEIPLTHQDIADVLTITRETATRSLNQLKSEKLIKTNKYITIPDIEALESEAVS